MRKSALFLTLLLAACGGGAPVEDDRIRIGSVEVRSANTPLDAAKLRAAIDRELDFAGLRPVGFGFGRGGALRVEVLDVEFEQEGVVFGAYIFGRTFGDLGQARGAIAAQITDASGRVVDRFEVRAYTPTVGPVFDGTDARDLVVGELDAGNARERWFYRVFAEQIVEELLAR